MKRQTLVLVDECDLVEPRQWLADASPEMRAVATDWYPSVHDRTKLWALETGYSHEQVVAVLALYSINQGWKGNVTLAKRALYDGVYDGLSLVRERVARVLTGEPIVDCLTRQRKVPDFYTRILYGYGVPIDRHMAACFGKTGPHDAVRHYGYCVRAIEHLAVEVGMRAEDVQPLLWLLRIAHMGKALRHYLPNVG